MQILACTGLHGIVRVVPWVFKVQEALVTGTSAAAVAEPSSVCVCVCSTLFVFATLTDALTGCVPLGATYRMQHHRGLRGKFWAIR